MVLPVYRQTVCHVCHLRIQNSGIQEIEHAVGATGIVRPRPTVFLNNRTGISGSPIFQIKNSKSLKYGKKRTYT